MTDADVDGSPHPHAAADLLLPQMPELIERGHIYIGCRRSTRSSRASRSCTSRTITALGEYLIANAVEDARAVLRPDAPALTGAGSNADARIPGRSWPDRRLGRRFDPVVMRALLDLPPLSAATFQDQRALGPGPRGSTRGS
jgi:DNA gyrase subunit B